VSIFIGRMTRQPDSLSNTADAMCRALRPFCAARHQGPGLEEASIDCVKVDGVTMVHAATMITPEDRIGRQLVRDPNGSLLSWDGRLDNRRDLACRVQGASRLSDAELVMRLYAQAGASCFRWLVGDWSLALWDQAARTMLLCSDYMGIRPLYYAPSEDGVAWSSDITLLQDLGIASRLDLDYLYLYLILGNVPDRTPFSGVKSVTPGELLIFPVEGQPRSEPIWKLPQGSLTLRDAREYEQEFLRLLCDAVDARLRAISPVTFELSGGLDSSTLVCVAHRLLGRRDEQAPSDRMRLVSHVTERSPEADERPWIAEVERAVGLRAMHVPLDDRLAVAQSYKGYPHAISRVGALAHDDMAAHGSSVLVSGRGGDTVCGNTLDDSAGMWTYASLRRAPRLIAGCRRWALGTKRSIWHCLNEALAPHRSRRHFTAFLERDSLGKISQNSQGSGDLASMLRDSFAVTGDRAVALQPLFERYAASVLESNNGASWRQVYRVITYSRRRSLLTPPESPGLTKTYPFMHRPLVEFSLSIPSDELVRPGQPRLLMRRALAGVLPEAIRTRTSKGFGPASLQRTYRHTAKIMLRDLSRSPLQSMPFVDMDAVRKQCQALVDGANLSLNNFWRIALLEAWLLSLGQASDTPAATVIADSPIPHGRR
jgi:asparagine synthase (glutamine-hydrolysing)